MRYFQKSVISRCVFYWLAVNDIIGCFNRFSPKVLSKKEIEIRTDCSNILFLHKQNVLKTSALIWQLHFFFSQLHVFYFTKKYCQKRYFLIEKALIMRQFPSDISSLSAPAWLSFPSPSSLTVCPPLAATNFNEIQQAPNPMQCCNSEFASFTIKFNKFLLHGFDVDRYVL